MREESRVSHCFKNGTSATAPVVYFLFDLLWCDGRDITGKTVAQRRERLQEIITPISGIQVGGYAENRGTDLFRLAKEKDWKGSSPNERRAPTNLAGAHRIG
jgi:ATP-dependent DNA ligase